MKFNNIIANPPYAKIGCDITKKVIEQNPASNYAMLGTRSMFKPFYADTLACAFVQIEKYELGSNKKLDWGVRQAILLATNGWTEVVDNRKKVGDNRVGVAKSSIDMFAESDGRSSHLVGTCISPVTNLGYITGHITEMCEVQGDMRGKLIDGRAPLVQVNKSEPYLGGAMDRHTANVKLRSGYIYVSFETFEEACECAIDIISWKNPTDSHYRCVKWGFVQGLKAHERFNEQ